MLFYGDLPRDVAFEDSQAAHEPDNAYLLGKISPAHVKEFVCAITSSTASLLADTHRLAKLKWDWLVAGIEPFSLFIEFSCQIFRLLVELADKPVLKLVVGEYFINEGENYD